MENQKTIILFYMNGCGHCDQFKPIWNKLKPWCTKHNVRMREFEANEVQTMQFNQSLNDTGIDMSRVIGFPTIIIMDNGKEVIIKDRREEKIKELLLNSEKKQTVVQTGGGMCTSEKCIIQNPKENKYYHKYLKYKSKYLFLRKNLNNF